MRGIQRALPYPHCYAKLAKDNCPAFPEGPMSYRAPIDSQPWNPYFLNEKTCQQCGQLYLGRGPGGKFSSWVTPFYCSVGCRTEARRQRRAEAREPKKRIKCVQCSERFTPQRSTARFCSARCRVAAHRASVA